MPSPDFFLHFRGDVSSHICPERKRLVLLLPSNKIIWSSMISSISSTVGSTGSDSSSGLFSFRTHRRQNSLLKIISEKMENVKIRSLTTNLLGVFSLIWSAEFG